MKKTIYLLLILFGLMMIVSMVGCKTYFLNKYCKSSFQIKDSISFLRKDSTYINIKDSVIIKEGGSVNIDLGNPCDSLTGKLKEMNLKFKNGINNTSFNTNSGRLIINSNCESQIEIYRNRLTYLENQLSDSQYQIKQETKVIERPLTWWQELKIGFIGDLHALLSIIFCLYICHKLYQHIKSLPHG